MLAGPRSCAPNKKLRPDGDSLAGANGGTRDGRKHLRPRRVQDATPVRSVWHGALGKVSVPS